MGYKEQTVALGKLTFLPTDSCLEQPVCARRPFFPRASLGQRLCIRGILQGHCCRIQGLLMNNSASARLNLLRLHYCIFYPFSLSLHVFSCFLLIFTGISHPSLLLPSTPIKYVGYLILPRYLLFGGTELAHSSIRLEGKNNFYLFYPVICHCLFIFIRPPRV